MSPLAQSLVATFLVSAVSLVGVIFLFTDWTERRAMLFVSFAAGVLLATAFLEMFPEAVRAPAGRRQLLHRQRSRRWGASFSSSASCSASTRTKTAMAPRRPSGYFVLIGSTVHNFIDGVVIAASFLVSPTLGFTTTLAVAAHEIPHEAADFLVLRNARFSRTQRVAA